MDELTQFETDLSLDGLATKISEIRDIPVSDEESKRKEDEEAYAELVAEGLDPFLFLPMI